jgi:NADH:ubiquinone oxidoreductase subunit E
MLKEKYQEEIDEIISRYPVKRSALIPLLYLAQRDEGFISEAAMKEIAGLLRLTPPQVYETATFYTMLNLKRVGKFHLQVCKSLMCALAGSDTVIGWIKTKLGIGPGETRGRMPRSLWHCADDAGQRGLLRTAHRGTIRQNSGRPQAERDLSAQDRPVYVA